MEDGSSNLKNFLNRYKIYRKIVMLIKIQKAKGFEKHVLKEQYIFDRY
jgi:hypothetical protein